MNTNYLILLHIGIFCAGTFWINHETKIAAEKVATELKSSRELQKVEMENIFLKMKQTPPTTSSE